MSSAAETTPGPNIFEVEGWRRVVAWLLSLVVVVWSRTLKMEYSEADRAAFAAVEPGAMLIFWHNRILGAVELHRRCRRGRSRVAGLISASKDGAWLAAFFRAIGVDAVRGSSGRRGTEGAREILAVLKARWDAGITVDGSRGPVYEAKEGAMLLARKSGAPLVFLNVHYHSAWRLKSWDGFFIPKPFSRVTASVEVHADVEAFAPGADRREATALLTRRLRELAAGSDPLLGL